MYIFGRLSKTEKIKGVTIQYVVKQNIKGGVYMMVKADEVILAQSLFVEYDKVLEQLIQLNIGVENYFKEKDEARQLANQLLKIGFKSEHDIE